MVIESILINFERCSVNSVGCRTLEAELVTLAKVLAACSQMLTMDMVSIARFCQVWLGCGLWQVQRVRITLSFHITFTLFTNQNNLAFLLNQVNGKIFNFYPQPWYYTICSPCYFILDLFKIISWNKMYKSKISSKQHNFSVRLRIGRSIFICKMLRIFFKFIKLINFHLFSSVSPFRILL